MTARQLLEYLDALKTRTSEPSERIVAEWRELAEQKERTIESLMRVMQSATTRLLKLCDLEEEERALSTCVDDVELELNAEHQRAIQAEAERDRLQSELSEARAAVAKMPDVERQVRELRDSVNELARDHVPCSPLASRIEQSLTDILESLQPAAEKAEEKPAQPERKPPKMPVGHKVHCDCFRCQRAREEQVRLDLLECTSKKPTEDKPAECGLCENGVMRTSGGSDAARGRQRQ
jgi:hypothetical protein